MALVNAIHKIDSTLNTIREEHVEKALEIIERALKEIENK